MHEIHQRLIEKSQKTQDLDRRLETMRRDLDTEVQKNARLEPDVNNFREREKFLEKVNLLKMKRPWLVCRLSLHIYIFVGIHICLCQHHMYGNCPYFMLSQSSTPAQLTTPLSVIALDIKKWFTETSQIHSCLCYY